MKQILIIVFLLYSIVGTSQNNISKGLELLIKQKYKKSYQVYQKEIKSGKSYKHPEVYYFQGICNFNRYFSTSDKQDKTIDLFSKYIELKPMDPKGYLRRGIVYLNRWCPNLAAADFSKSISLNPLLIESYYYYAFALSEISDTNYAKEDNYFSIFISMMDSTNSLYDLAYHNREQIRKKFNDIKVNDDFDKVKTDYYDKLWSSPIGLKYYDTISFPYTNSKSILDLCGILVSDNSEDEPILLNKLKKSKSLSEIINIDSIISYTFCIWRNTQNNSSENIEITCNSDEFNEAIKMNLSSVKLGDMIVFHYIISKDYKGKKLHHQAISFKVEIDCAYNSQTQ
ncbi:MAG: hypothetical protein K9J13_06430 [Saprospiraceae bacterium]|nr:hypothetical protein [Saprospiraceae bacterium]